jgi:hypothetical protein
MPYLLCVLQYPQFALYFALVFLGHRYISFLLQEFTEDVSRVPTYLHYQSLRNFEDLPALPLGYPGMFFLALFPAAYRAVMDKRTVAWAGGDLSKIQIRKGKRAYYERKFADAA